MSVGDAITCECNNCVDQEIKTVSPRHAEAFEALEHLFAQRTGASWHPAPVSPRRMMGMRCSKPISGSKPRSIKPSRRDASVSRRSRPRCN